MDFDSMSREQLITVLGNFFVKAKHDIVGTHIVAGNYYCYLPTENDDEYVLYPFCYIRNFDPSKDIAVISKGELIEWGGFARCNLDFLSELSIEREHYC